MVKNKKYFGFFLVSYISIQKKKCTSEQFLQGRPSDGHVMFSFISFHYFQYFRDQIPKGGFQDSGCPKNAENLGLGDLCLKYNDAALSFLEAQSSCLLSAGLVLPPFDIIQNTILRSVNFNEIIFNYHFL